MSTTVDVNLPVDPEAARVLEDPARRRAAGRVLSDLLVRGRLPQLLEEALCETKRQARASGLTDEIIDEELAAWKRERQE